MGDRLRGKVAIVTGAGSRGPGLGNGKAAAILFAREGARVLCVDQRRSRGPRRRSTLIRGRGRRGGGARRGRHAGRGVPRAWCRRRSTRWGGLDVLHNNVGIESRQDLLETTEEEWDRVLEVDLKSVFLATQAAAPAIDRPRRRLGDLRVVDRRAPRPRAHGVRGRQGRHRGLRPARWPCQLGPQGVRINAIAPGTVWTPMVEGLGARGARARAARRARSAPRAPAGTWAGAPSTWRATSRAG